MDNHLIIIIKFPGFIIITKMRALHVNICWQQDGWCPSSGAIYNPRILKDKKNQDYLGSVSIKNLRFGKQVRD